MRSEPAKMIEVDVRLTDRETAKAIHVISEFGEAIWLPRSQISHIEPAHGSDGATLTVPEWLAVDKGLV